MKTTEAKGVNTEIKLKLQWTVLFVLQHIV
jgi:hypothetical protein